MKQCVVRLWLLMVASVCMNLGVAKGQSVWKKVEERYRIADYEGMRQILDTVRTKSNKDSVIKNGWLGEYYYWMSYEDENSVDTARQLFETAINFGKQNHISFMPYGIYYLHLGELCYLSKNYEEGIKCLEKALSEFPYRVKYGKPQDPTPIYKGLGMSCAMLGDYDRAIDFLKRCQMGVKDAYSAVRMLGKVYAMKGDRDSAVVCYSQFVRSIDSVVNYAFGVMNKVDRESWWMSVRPFITDCWRLESAAPEMLYDVALLTKGILLQQNSALKIKHEDVAKALAPGSVAIEWLTYEKEGEKHLGAVVMRADGSVRFVHSCTVSDLYAWADDIDGIFDNQECINSIWSPAMLKAIGRAKKIYFAPDGLLCQLGIEYMYHYAQGKQVKLYRLSSTRELLKQRNYDYSSAAIFGNMDYDLVSADTSMLPIFNDTLAYRHMKKLRATFKHLPCSAEECDSVAALRASAGDTVVLSHSATERNFRDLAEKYEMLFISTHGYCRVEQRIENSDFPRKELVDRSLSESGLVFSGYNAEQRNRSSSPTDGIVSARELCDMNLSKVNLCVVSACEGALGRVSADGTYGIQRGLKAAGVQTMILSTWEVDDRATTCFMTFFCQALAQGKDVHSAFQQARERLYNYRYVAIPANPDIPESKPVMRGFHSDKYRNMFILIDDI